MPSDPMDCFPVLHHFLELAPKLMSIESVMPSTISSSVVAFCFPSFPESVSFPMSRLFASGGQSIGASTLPSVIPMDCSGLISFRINWFALLSVQGDSQESSPTPQFKSINSSAVRLLYGTTLTSIYDDWKNHSFDYMDLCRQSESLLFNMLSRFVIAFLPRNKHFLISWLQSPSTVILEPKKIKSVIVSFVFPSIFHVVMGPDPIIFIFWIGSHKA